MVDTTFTTTSSSSSSSPSLILILPNLVVDLIFFSRREKSNRERTFVSLDDVYYSLRFDSFGGSLETETNVGVFLLKRGGITTVIVRKRRRLNDVF